MEFKGLAIGHQTRKEQGTGVTVFLLDNLAPCSYSLCGSAPATRELAILDPSATVGGINALVFAGGSAFGLAAADGAMAWCAEQGRGFSTPAGVVPLIPAACIYDLETLSATTPTKEDGYAACQAAVSKNYQQGRIGAASGATVGKYFSDATPMPGGFGLELITTPEGVQILAAAVVNSVGEIIDATGQILAGARGKDGQIKSITAAIAQGQPAFTPLSAQNTTLVAVFTNVALNKGQLQSLAKAASAGIAKAIMPAFSVYDGDVVFCTSMGEQVAEPVLLGALAEQAVRAAIYKAVRIQ